MAASLHNENSDMFSDPNEEDDFVDARETPMPTSPTFSRQGSKVGKKLSAKEMENKVEELVTENKSLKVAMDKVSKRLYSFEMSAQQNGMALQESMRLIRDMSPARDQSFGRAPVGGTGDEALKRRVLELEEHVALGGKEIERLGRENDKLKNVMARYRDRWEKLKEGAKTRREGGKDASGKDGSSKKDADPGAGRFMAG
jgi:regulator of replication initiation timing